jgi:hypothetical protein
MVPRKPGRWVWGVWVPNQHPPKRTQTTPRNHPPHPPPLTKPPPINTTPHHHPSQTAGVFMWVHNWGPSRPGPRRGCRGARGRLLRPYGHAVNALGLGEGHATDVRPADCRELYASRAKNVMLCYVMLRSCAGPLRAPACVL